MIDDFGSIFSVETPITKETYVITATSNGYEKKAALVSIENLDALRPHAALSNRRGLAKLTECFGGDERQALTFLQNTWLPDAFAIVTSLAKSAKNKDLSWNLFLGAHFKTSAQEAGFNMIIALANKVEAAGREEQWAEVRRLCEVTIRALEAIAGWLHDKTSSKCLI